VIEVVAEPDDDAGMERAFTTVTDGQSEQKPYPWQASASGVNLLGVSGNPTLEQITPDRRAGGGGYGEYASHTMDDGGMGVHDGASLQSLGRLATV
jgi:hypothetical protein